MFHYLALQSITYERILYGSAGRSRGISGHESAAAMSHEAAQAFIEKRKSDEAFRARVMAVEDVAGRLELINAEGFDCTVEEVDR